ncbi:Neuropilin-2 [Acropora cervicornis]|uniref:Neuropilin-2 n=1 Tax=Acropora cervicornis TaxID=6130 RepID=A0AAD9VDL5_ACRCE|nr:Neuropilin-2 [Acropora cervicornis]
MELRHFLLQVGFCLIFAAHTSGSISDEGTSREKRSSTSPELAMEISFENVTDYLRHGDHYGYVTTLKHTPSSVAAAKGVHVTWMLAPFIKFLNIIADLPWGAEFTVSFKVEFDPERTLKPSNYSLVTPVQLLYYDDYLENSQGILLSKGRYFSNPLDKVAFNIELPATDAWCAKTNDKNQYLQVDFLLKTRVTRLGTMRRKSKDHWVTKYSLQYSDDDISWFDYMENGYVKVFKGPQTSSDTEMITHYLRHPVEANYIRVRPLAWVQLICLRLELYGCDIPGSPALSHSLPSSDLSKPSFIRLHGLVSQYPFGWQARIAQIPPDYLQIDFGSLRKVTRIATMGAFKVASLFVTTFKLEYSRNGPQNRHESKFPVLAKLAEPFVSRYVRIIPNDALKSMRAEIYGCFVEQLPPYTDVPEYARRSFLLDPVTDRFFACMYTDDQTESSCFSTVDGVEWIAVKPLIVSIIACSPIWKEIYGLDRRMNFHRSCDSGETWRQITDGYVKEVREEPNLVRAKSLPENLVSQNPSTNFIVTANSTGITWGVSGAGIHIMTIGDHSWSMVGSWKCCGL